MLEFAYEVDHQTMSISEVSHQTNSSVKSIILVIPYKNHDEDIYLF